MAQQKPDEPTPERLKLAGDAVEDFVTDTGRHTVRMMDDSVLDYLNNRGCITGDQYHAGSQFYADWYYSGLANSGVIDPGRVVVDGGPGAQASDKKLDAMTRWKDAVQAVGRVHSAVLVAVVLLGERLDHYGRRRFKQTNRERQRLTAITALQLALEALDGHYYGKRRARTVSAHAEGYRPGIEPLDKSCT